MQKYCMNCNHCRRDYPWALLLVPVVGWVVFAALVFCGLHLEHSRCGASIRDYKNYLFPEKQKYKYCSLSREYGPCGDDAKLFSPRGDVA